MNQQKWMPGLLALGIVATIGCATDGTDEPLTFDEFVAQARVEPETGLLVVNGDEVIASDDQLRATYARYVSSAKRLALAEQGAADTSSELIVNRVGGADDKWSSTTATNLTYCISRSSMGTTARYDTTVTAMNNATAAWEAAAPGRINFVHASQYDNNCTSSTPVTFDVRRVQAYGQYLARAFFPSYPRSQRNVYIDRTGYGNVSPYTLTGILRHELGHTLGFRHEHTRPESGTCFEDNNWRALTSYDSASVMHYPQCNGSQTGDLVLTSRDSSGAALLYP